MGAMAKVTLPEGILRTGHDCGDMFEAGLT